MADTLPSAGGTLTIRDVANHAGCSTATVSRALNAPEKVDPHMLEAVHAAIRATGYRPSALGRMLRAGQSRLIGVLVPTIANPVFGETLQGIDEYAAQAGYRLMLMTTEYDRDRERLAIETLRQHRVDGLILTVSDAVTNPHLDALDRIGLPYVLAHNDAQRTAPSASVASSVASSAAPSTALSDALSAHAAPSSMRDQPVTRASVSVNNFKAARDGVRQMLAFGHQRIRMLAGTLTASDRAQQRFAGYAAAMREAGLTPAPVVEATFAAERLDHETLHALMGAEYRPSALFCSNDRLAMISIAALNAGGVTVPRGMSVMGFDGLSEGNWLTPTLTSVCVPNREIGRRAWQCLQATIERRAKSSAVSSTVVHASDILPPPQPDAAVTDEVNTRTTVHLDHTIRVGGTLSRVC